MHAFLLIMSLFHHEEPPNPSKRCKFLKDALATCYTFCRELSSQTLEQQRYEEEEEDDDVSNYDDEQEVFVSAVLSKYMEAKSKRKLGLSVDSFIWGFSFSPIEVIPPRNEIPHAYESDAEEKDEFYSTCSHLSRCSSSMTAAQAFMSVKTNISRCSSMSSIEFPPYRKRRSIMRELCHCEGWPFGLCRKALLVPPLPKSPSESWMWHKTTRLIKIL
ncbi:uncharacterized protein LOC111885895 [Lactuca sativa]|uniref:Uncharacterized protein n=1 Tax=Lactuca sativa TaxID=4236 RepID=A0A9R1VUQ1_LACSA|nr:uncharacterized protein LOC111885895 [Lactuca sativa]KAJ0214252.1 hypothetical protein LSAT_V11C400205820 [Lactuca sativa]